jgi:hypothetical protein
MIKTICDRCESDIDPKTDSYQTLAFVAHGANGIPKIVFGDKADRPPINVVGQYCISCYNAIVYSGLRKEIRASYEDMLEATSKESKQDKWQVGDVLGRSVWKPDEKVIVTAVGKGHFLATGPKPNFEGIYPMHWAESDWVKVN